MVSSAAMSGGELAQKSFRQTVSYCKVNMMEQPEIFVKRFSGKMFNEDGDLVHEETIAKLKEFLTAFA
jgi:NAD(P)H-dependent FMN reductase